MEKSIYLWSRYNSLINVRAREIPSARKKKKKIRVNYDCANEEAVVITCLKKTGRFDTRSHRCWISQRNVRVARDALLQATLEIVRPRVRVFDIDMQAHAHTSYALVRTGSSSTLMTLPTAWVNVIISECADSIRVIDARPRQQTRRHARAHAGPLISTIN